MASKTGQETSASLEDIEELLDGLDKTLDRLKTLYEQYFLGIQKQPPAYIHTDVERKLRDLMQMQIRNTGLRYRLNSLQAKFGSYNSYWRRTLRQIENGTYIRNLSKIGRQAARSGADIPDEILAAMPKRMRDQVLRDREVALAAARRTHQVDDETLTLADEDAPAVIKEPTDLRRQVRSSHVVTEDAEFDLDAFFKEVESADSTEKTPPDRAPVMPPRTEPAPLRAASLGGPARPSSPSLRTPTGQMPAQPPQGTGPVQSQGTGPVPRQPTAPIAGVPRQPTGPQPTGAIPRQPTGPQPTGAIPRQPTGPQPAAAARPPSGPQPTGAIPRMPTGPVPAVPNPSSATGPVPRQPTGPQQSGAIPRMPTGPLPAVPRPPAPSQTTRPNPIAPGSAAARGDVGVESMSGPFPRAQTEQSAPPVARPPGSPIPPTPRPPGAPRPAPPVSSQSQPIPRPTPAPRPEPANKPPPGMTDADVNALYAKYVKAKEAVGEKVGPGGYGKLLSTLNAQAPKIMEQHKAKGVDFSVVVKDNQVIIRAKPKP